MRKIYGPDIHQSINTSVLSAQQVELTDSINLLRLIHKCVNVVSDSVYVVGLFPAIERALILSSHAVGSHYYRNYCNICYSTHPLFITHTCAQPNLHGFIAEGNKKANALTCPVFTFFPE